MRRPLPTAIVICALLGLLTAPLPTQAQRVSNPELFSKSLQVAQQALDLYGSYDNPQAMERVAEIGYRLASKAHFDDFPFTFHLVEMAAPNAFALPGGHIFITRGMLELNLTDDMLAGIIGHEISHVTRHHGTRMQRRATLLNVLSQAVLVGVMMSADSGPNRDEGLRAPYDPRVRYPSQSSQEIVGAMATGIVVSELLMRGYSRDFEREADDEGQRLAAAAGFDPAGLGDLMALMSERLPQSKQYGYWQTHPFFDERIRGAAARGAQLKAQPPTNFDDFRLRTQAALLTYLEKNKLVRMGLGNGQGDGKGTGTKGTGKGKGKSELIELVKTEALTAWPIGAKAEEIRLQRLHKLRDKEMDQLPISRDYGTLITAYTEAEDLIERLDAKSPLLARLRSERAEIQLKVTELYPQAIQVLARGVYETSFLERFQSNFPDAPEAARVALALGDAHSRLGKVAEAVKQYLLAWESDPESDESKRAQRGLHVLAPDLDNLAALEQMVRQERDLALADIARKRLDRVASSYEDLANGASYLARFPDGSRVTEVTDRLNSLAADLYAAVILYQGVGDNAKALERINQILTHAPTSPAAAQLRDRASVAEG